MILVDTGPLVALIHEDDNAHHTCKETFLTVSEPLGTVWPVLTEAMYLLGGPECSLGNDRSRRR
jgi:uncharacterized protein